MIKWIRALLPGKDDCLRKEELMKFSEYDCHRGEERLDLFPVFSSEISGRNQIKLEDAGFMMGKDPSGKWQLSCRTPCT